MLNMTINGKNFELINSVKIGNKTYMSYTDGENTYISEYKYINNKIVIYEVNNEDITLIKEKLLNEK